MNHYVPDFEMDDDVSTSSGFSRPNTKPSLPEDDLMELLWQNGQVVMQSQTQKTSKRSHPLHSSTSTEQPPSQLFMQEDEMASWLHYPLEDETFQRDFCSDLLYPAPSTRVNQIPVATPPLPLPPAPIPPGKQRDELESGSTKFHHFMRFSRPNVRAESQPSVSDKAVRETTVVESNETPTVRLNQDSMNHDGGAADQDREVGTCDLTMTSSSGGSGGSADPLAKPPLNDRKRKGREHDDDDDDDDDEDAKYEAADTKKQVRGSASARRSRAAEVHNLSERRRRDRINEKMKALQELIPRCNKSDKASMLDEAIEYLKSLQLQVQMMSMGCSMVPVMFPGVQPYMSPMGMSMSMGMGMMGMGMDMGMSRPMMPFSQVLAGSSMPRPAAAAHLTPRLPMQAYHLPPGSSPDASVMRPNQPDPSLNPIGFRSPNPMQVPFTESYQHYLSHYNMQAPPPPPQVHTMARASTSKGVDSLKNQKLG